MQACVRPSCFCCNVIVRWLGSAPSRLRVGTLVASLTLAPPRRVLKYRAAGSSGRTGAECKATTTTTAITSSTITTKQWRWHAVYTRLTVVHVASTQHTYRVSVTERTSICAVHRDSCQREGGASIFKSPAVERARCTGLRAAERMGSGKSWSAHENGALASAWVAAWRELGNATETSTRSFLRSVYVRFIATPPQSNCSTGRYSARSEEACRQHFKDLAAEVRRAGSVRPSPNSAIADAWHILRTVPRFQTTTTTTTTGDETSSPSTPSKKRARVDVAASGTAEGETTAAATEFGKVKIGLNDALKAVASAVHALAEAQSERNALAVFSERECIDSEHAREQRGEYLATLRRIYLHKARARERALNANGDVAPGTQRSAIVRVGRDR